MKQKLGLACALIHKPRLLLLDEPSVGVDPISRRELWRMVYDLVDEGIGVVWSTAYLDEAERCATVLLLNQGQQLYFGPPKELTARAPAAAFYWRIWARAAAMLASVIKTSGRGRRRDPRSQRATGDCGRLPFPNRRGAGGSPRRRDRTAAIRRRVCRPAGRRPKYESPLGQCQHERWQKGHVVEAIGLTKQFGNFMAAQDISFRIPRGESTDCWAPTARASRRRSK